MSDNRRVFWEATFVSASRAASINPGKHALADGRRVQTPADVAELAAELADAALVEHDKRWPG